MPEIEIDDIASVGAVRDTPGYQLPPEAWTEAMNMQIVDNGMETMKGWVQVFGTLPFGPRFAMAINTAGQTFWLYTSLSRAAVYSGGTSTEVTRTSGNYNAGGTKDWNGTFLGAIPILNSGNDVPQYWPSPNPAVKLADLPNWGVATVLAKPATTRAKVVRAFGPYLFALHITDADGVHPHTFHWSHPAEPGGVPISWDYTDVNRSSRRFDLQDVESGVILDALRLQGALYIYKESAVWRCTFVGGTTIFDLKPFLETVGLLAPRCMTSVMAANGPRHVLATQDDIIWHNGNEIRSVLNERQKKKLFQEIDTASFAESFMFNDPENSQALFCYPAQGAQFPNRALVMNYIKDPWRLTEADGITFRNVAVGTVETSSGEIWDAGVDLWSDDTGPWSQVSRRKLIACAPIDAPGGGPGVFLQLNTGTTRNGLPFVGRLYREGLSLLGRKRNGEWIVDFQRLKMVDRLWPKVQRGPVNVRIGTQEFVNGAVSFQSAAVFDPATMMFLDPEEPKSGRAIAVEYTGADFRLDGYKINVNGLGEF